MSSLAVEVRPEGLYLPSLELFLDPTRGVPRAFVSHAHGDHLADGAPSGEILASRETLALVEARRGVVPSRVIAWDGALELPCDGGTARLSIAPAGHVLGAAQLVVDHPRGRFVYTGDYRSGAGRTCRAGAPVECDAIVVESTFGLPIFRFPPRAETERAIVAWCRATLDEGATPVLLGYALGKAQELVHLCLEAALPVVAHGAVHKIAAAYEALGHDLGVRDGRLRPYAEERKGKLAAVLVSPPWTQSQAMIRRRKDARVAYVSGWALLDVATEQRRADAAFPLSDHADFDDLVATIAASKAREIFVTHGDDVEVFARIVGGAPLAAPPIDQQEPLA